MVEYILGNYLVETGKITKEQLKQALDMQDSVRVKLGLIAVSEGMMTLEQADEVNRLQAIKNQRFGDIAVEKGYLTNDQVAKLLHKQGNGYLTFVQTLVDCGFIVMDEVDELINNFRQERGYSLSELDALKSDEAGRIIPLFIPDEAKQFTEIITTAVCTIIRLIDRHVYIGNAEITNTFPGDNQVSQALEGNSGIIDCFSEGDGALLNLSSIFGKEDFVALDMDSLDAAGEFLNCVNGLYASYLSNQSIFLELAPPDYDDVTEKTKMPICKVPIYVGSQSLYFIVAELL